MKRQTTKSALGPAVGDETPVAVAQICLLQVCVCVCVCEV